MSCASISWRQGGLGLTGICALLLVLVSCTEMPNTAPQATGPTGTHAGTTSAVQAGAPPPSEKVDRDGVMDERAVIAAQLDLAQLGYDIGKADGIEGPATRRAILSFQKDHGLADDGRLTLALARKLKTLAAETSADLVIVVHPGDMLVYSDGEVEIAGAEHEVQWGKDVGARKVVAIRPPMQDWPAAARTGLDWALTHALDSPATVRPVKWSSTGVAQHFEIRVFAALSRQVEELSIGSSHTCRQFDMRSDVPRRRYPGIACRDASGSWYIPHSTIWLARPVSALGTAAWDGSDNPG